MPWSSGAVIRRRPRFGERWLTHKDQPAAIVLTRSHGQAWPTFAVVVFIALNIPAFIAFAVSVTVNVAIGRREPVHDAHAAPSIAGARLAP